jgi:DNA-binding response OmpR family regulator
VALLLETALTEAGHEALGPVGSVADGLELTAATVPDLALVNINLQSGGSGVDLARTRLERHGTLSIFVSGNMNEARRAQDVALGYITKPYDVNTVVAAVDVAKAILDGQKPDRIPNGLELFRNTPPGQG